MCVPKKDIFSVIFPTGHSPELVRPVLHPLPSPHTHTSLHAFTSLSLAVSSRAVIVIPTRSLPIILLFLLRFLFPLSAAAGSTRSGQRLHSKSSATAWRRIKQGRFSLFSTPFSFGSSQKRGNNNNYDTTTITTKTTSKRQRNTRGRPVAVARNNNNPYNQPVKTAPGNGNNNTK